MPWSAPPINPPAIPPRNPPNAFPNPESNSTTAAIPLLASCEKFPLDISFPIAITTSSSPPINIAVSTNPVAIAATPAPPSNPAAINIPISTATEPSPLNTSTIEFIPLVDASWNPGILNIPPIARTNNSTPPIAIAKSANPIAIDFILVFDKAFIATTVNANIGATFSNPPNTSFSTSIPLVIFCLTALLLVNSPNASVKTTTAAITSPNSANPFIIDLNCGSLKAFEAVVVVFAIPAVEAIVSETLAAVFLGIANFIVLIPSRTITAPAPIPNAPVIISPIVLAFTSPLNAFFIPFTKSVIPLTVNATPNEILAIPPVFTNLPPVNKSIKFKIFLLNFHDSKAPPIASIIGNKSIKIFLIFSACSWNLFVAVTS